MIIKKTCLLLIVLVSSLVSRAGEVTPAEALQKALRFVQERLADGSIHLPDEMPTLTIGEQVNGIYVINIGDDDGFVIVSPDDCAVEILGYSDSGSFGTGSLPDNLKAWFDAYANQIDWAKANAVSSSPKSRRALRRAGSLGAAISPLVQTKWNQGLPYNYYCPMYQDLKFSATGCAATAMAQVMYYTEMKADSTTTYTTTEIPAYTTKELGLSVAAIPANSEINWSAMKTTYSVIDAENASGQAVARLMQYCGASIEMDYNKSSSAYTSDVAIALKKYFGYGSTVAYKVRSNYDYDEWTALIYQELSAGRPVLYKGQKLAGGGHAFVCDGYQSDDYFHINWGWGGSSDGYFKLSALHPSYEGIGGSSASGGYSESQAAVIGIRKKGTQLSLYDADGNKSVLNSVNNYVVPAGASAVDLSDNTEMTQIDAHNASPNCIYILEVGTTVSGLPVSANIVMRNGSDYRASSLSLTDGQDFWSPYAIQAENAEFTYNVSSLADGTNGWSTIILPFDVTRVTADGTEIDWFRDDTEYGKNFWLKEFKDDSGSQVNFAHATMFKANTPYIIALPGNGQWNSRFDLTGKTIRFIGQNVTIGSGTASGTVPGNGCHFVGSTRGADMSDIYQLNSSGNQFVLQNSGHSSPFRAYFKSVTNSPAPRLTIGTGSGTTGIRLESIKNKEISEGNLYDLNGRVLEDIPRQKGIYIQNGRKFVVR